MKYWHSHLSFGQHISVSTLVYVYNKNLFVSVHSPPHSLMFTFHNRVLKNLRNIFRKSFDFERTWWRLFQKRAVRTKFVIYVFILTLVLFFMFSDFPMSINLHRKVWCCYFQNSFFFLLTFYFTFYLFFCIVIILYLGCSFIRK